MLGAHLSSALRRRLRPSTGAFVRLVDTLLLKFGLDGLDGLDGLEGSGEHAVWETLRRAVLNLGDEWWIRCGNKG